MLKEFLEKGKCFKLICGAGNKDFDEIEKLITVYAKAGCRFFDISADEKVLTAVKRGIEKSRQKEKCYICISVGVKEDIHTSKFQIEQDKCIQCGLCKEVCERNAIRHTDFYYVEENRCIGCGKCFDKCPQNAIFRKTEKNSLKEILTDKILESADCIEFHISGGKNEEVYADWQYLNSKFDGILSICLNRKESGDKDFSEILKTMVAVRKPYSTIIQADGNPMSGGADDFETTLQSVAAGQIVQKLNLPVFLMLSGGTNGKTSPLAKLCNVNICGIAMGSFARKKVAEYINSKNFWKDEKIFQMACHSAENVIKMIDNEF